MFGIGSTELVIILIFGFLLFGPDKLPQMGRTVGRALRQFRETQEKMTAMVQSEVIDPMAAVVQEPAKKPGAAPASALDDDDADLPTASATPARKETFAERRARLAAERVEREAAPAAGADAPGGAEDEDTAPASAAGAEPAAADEAPAPRTTADLYARRPRKRPAAPAAADDPAAAASDAATPEGGER